MNNVAKEAFEQWFREESGYDSGVRYKLKDAWLSAIEWQAARSECGQEAVDPDIQLIQERDYWEEKATELAEDVGKFLGIEMGEHSSDNCPVQNAIDALFNTHPQSAQTGVPDGWDLHAKVNMPAPDHKGQRVIGYRVTIPEGGWAGALDWLPDLATPQPEGELVCTACGKTFDSQLCNGGHDDLCNYVKRPTPPTAQGGEGDE